MKKEIIKPFDLAKAKAGAKLRTRNGKPVEIFKWDARGDYPIKGIIKEKEYDKSTSWKLNGSWCNSPNSFDLVIVEEVEEPKLKIGDFVKHEYYPEDTYIVKSVDLSGDYELDSVDVNKGKHIAKATEDVIRLWDFTKDAKPGDVLYSVGFHSDCIFIFNELVNRKFGTLGDRAVATGYYCIFVSADNIEFGVLYPDCIEIKNIKPATNIQIDLLFQKMEEAGYEWDEEKLELKKIKPEFWSDDEDKRFNGFSILFGGVNKVDNLYNIPNAYHIFATKKQAKSALAMARISQIMANDIENFGGVVTDEEWKSLEWKYVIDRHDDRINTVKVRSVHHLLAFHTEKQRDLFLEKYPQLVRDFLMISDEETK